MNDDTTQVNIQRIAEKAIIAYRERDMVALKAAWVECQALGIKHEVDAIVKPAIAEIANAREQR